MMPNIYQFQSFLISKLTQESNQITLHCESQPKTILRIFRHSHAHTKCSKQIALNYLDHRWCTKYNCTLYNVQIGTSHCNQNKTSKTKTNEKRKGSTLFTLSYWHGNESLINNQSTQQIRLVLDENVDGIKQNTFFIFHFLVLLVMRIECWQIAIFKRLALMIKSRSLDIFMFACQLSISKNRKLIPKFYWYWQWVWVFILWIRILWIE